MRMVALAMAPPDERLLSICVSPAQLKLLKKLDYPGSQDVLASAVDLDDEGFELQGTRVDFEMLAGFVAGDANHTRPSRKQEQLHDIAEALESALASGHWWN